MSGEELKKAILNWQEKRYYFEYQLSMTAGADNTFELRTKIKECQLEIVRLKKLKSLEADFTTEADYNLLRELLAKGQWQQADEETVKVMLKVIGKEKQGIFNDFDIENFPCDAILQIDLLWRNLSNQNFGFSIQKGILDNLGDYSYEHWLQFGTAVRWCVQDKEEKNNWLLWEQLDFRVDAPKAHLPWLIFRCFGRIDYGAKLLLERLDSCKQPE